MKKKSIHLIFITIGFLVLVLGSPSLSITSNSYHNAVFPILVLGFCFSSSKTLNKVGYAINAVIGINAINSLEYSSGSIYTLGLLIMLVGSLTYFFAAICSFFRFTNKSNNSKDNDNDNNSKL
ncbi:MAG: hypothetical protein IKL82_04170 [Clostridia bacterium]|nr:hypothetical protein [Clostridia bacterium]